MFLVESDHGPGAVGFIGGEIARYHSFTMCFSGLMIPVGTKPLSGIGYESAYNRNAVIRTAYMVEKNSTDGWKFEWVQIWDDDHVFPPNTLISLLDTQADVVVPFYTQRQPPFRPCIYKREHEKGGWEIFDWTDLEGKSGLLPVAAAGAGGVVIRRRVLDALGDDNWFEHEGNVGEDMAFFRKCLAAGFQPHVALDIPLGHTSPVEVWPNRNAAGNWGARVDLKGSPPVLVEYWHEKYRGQQRDG